MSSPSPTGPTSPSPQGPSDVPEAPPREAEEVQLRLAIFTIRALFFSSAVGLGLYIARELATPQEQFLSMVTAGVLALLVIAVDAFTIGRSSIRTISSIVFGLLMGFLTAQLFLGLVSLMGEFEGTEGRQLLTALRLVLTLIFCYLGPVYLLRTRDDFRFIVPYVEFQRQAKGALPLVLDTSAIIDGRIVDLARAHLFDAPFLVPRSVVEELQRVADSGERGRRERGRRGLDKLRQLQGLGGVEVRLVADIARADIEVDRRLIELCQARGGKLVTVDYNLQKVCDLEGVPALNLNELAEACRLQLVAGESLRVRIARPGEGREQGVGYLDDGTMVVVEGARGLKGRTVNAVVTSSLQSSAGRMLFARLQQADDEEPGEPAPDVAPAQPEAQKEPDPPRETA